MDDEFALDEQLYRAVMPGEMYWRPDGTLTSAAFKDSKGLSVDRGDYRPDSDVVATIRSHGLSGVIVSVSVGDCAEISACPQYRPLPNNVYHSEIHGGKETVQLSRSQSKKLASKARIVSE